MATSADALVAVNTAVAAYGDARAAEVQSAPVSSGSTGTVASGAGVAIYTQEQHDADIAKATEALKAQALILEQNVETVMAVLKSALQPVVGTAPVAPAAPVTGDQSAASGATGVADASGASTTPVTTQSFVGQIKK